MKVYIAGRMRGLPQSGFPLFHAAAEDLRANGIEVMSPAEMDVALGLDPERAADGDHGYSRAELLLRDFALIADPTVDGVALLPNWDGSKGARAERAYAEAIDKGVWRYILPAYGPIILRDQLVSHPITGRLDHGADVWRVEAEERMLHSGRPA